MARGYRPVVRDQEFLLPPNMADWLPPDHLVWLVLDVVAAMDLGEFHRVGRRGGVGRAGFDPEMLLGLLVYAYAVGERSSRRIERLCVDHVAFRVACSGDVPDHCTIARFRARHEEAFCGVFSDVLRVCREIGMVRVGTIAVDGTKVGADASRGANRSVDGLRRYADQVAREVVAEAEETDAREDTGDDDHRWGTPPGFGSSGGRVEGISRALAELTRQDAENAAEDHADAVERQEWLKRAQQEPMSRPISGLDPVEIAQAKIIRFQSILDELQGVRGKAASQRRAEAKKMLKYWEKRLVEASNNPAPDLRGRAQRARDKRRDRAKARGAGGDVINTTDPDSRLMTTAQGGSIQGYNTQIAVSDDHIIIGVDVSQHANDTHCWEPIVNQAIHHTTKLGLRIGTILADAGYFTRDNLTSPGPDRLIAPGKNRDLPTHTTDPTSPDPRNQMRAKLTDPTNKQTYKRRSATVEPVIAHLKQRHKLTTFTRRGLHAAKAELHLTAAALNLTKLHAHIT